MDLINYYKSIGEELDALKNRIRSIMSNPHWPSDGEWKESILRTILKRHVPESVTVGRGFVYNEDYCSSQIDILIYDNSYPVMFKDGDFVFITPDAVRGIVEVKSKGTTRVMPDTLKKLIRNGEIVRNHGRKECFVGLFTFETDINDVQSLLNTIHEKVNGNKNKIITHVSLGKSHFLRYWEKDPETSYVINEWRAYKLENLAPAYFINNILSSLSPNTVSINQKIWFPGKSKERYKINNRPLA